MSSWVTSDRVTGFDVEGPGLGRRRRRPVGCAPLPLWARCLESCPDPPEDQQRGHRGHRADDHDRADPERPAPPRGLAQPPPALRAPARRTGPARWPPTSSPPCAGTRRRARPRRGRGTGRRCAGTPSRRRWPGSTSHSSFSSARRYLVRILVCSSTVWMSSPLASARTLQHLADRQPRCLVPGGHRGRHCRRRRGAARLGRGSAAQPLELGASGSRRRVAGGSAPPSKRSSIRGSSASETSTWRGFEPSYPEITPAALEHVDQAPGARVADPQASLDHRDRRGPPLDDDTRGLVEQVVVVG